MQPLSPAMQSILEIKTLFYIEKQEDDDKFSVDKTFWRTIVRKILAFEEPTTTLIAAAPAGYGKTVFLTAFILAIIWCFLNRPGFEPELSDVIISFQKVEDLNRLGKLVEDAFPDSDAYVALQGWTSSGKKEGFCPNNEVTNFEDCKAKTCPFANHCKMRSFQAAAPKAFVVGITHMRFKMIQGTPMLDQIINRVLPDGGIRERRYLIFDENPNLARISAMNNRTLNQASEEFDKLINKGQSTDRTAYSREKALSFGLTSVFNRLREATLVQLEELSAPLEVKTGICSIHPSDYQEQMGCYTRMKDTLQIRKVFSPTMRELTSVGDRLYSGESCIFCKNNGFTIFDIRQPEMEFENQQVILFDATAGIDADYIALKRAVYLPVPEPQRMEHVTFWVYQDMEFDVSRKRLNESWRLPLFARQICDILEHNREKTFICTYSNIAGTLYQELKSLLPNDLLQLVVTMPGKAEEGLPYIFGTNGSNAFNNCTQMIMLSAPTLNPETYLTHACAAFGTEKIMEEIREMEKNGDYLIQPWDCMKLPSVNDYAQRHTVTRLYQEIYRLAIRNRENTSPIQIHLFCPREKELKELLNLFPGHQLRQIKEAPPYFRIGKGSARQYQGEKTAFAKLADYIQKSTAFPRKVSEIRNELGISEAVWKDLMNDSRILELLKEKSIVCTGRGPNRIWNCCITPEKTPPEPDCA